MKFLLVVADFCFTLIVVMVQCLFWMSSYGESFWVVSDPITKGFVFVRLILLGIPTMLLGIIGNSPLLLILGVAMSIQAAFVLSTLKSQKA